MTRYIVELPEKFDPTELKLNGFELADVERARQELQKTLASNVSEIKQKLAEEAELDLNEQRMKINSSKLTREEAIEQLRKTEMLLDARARCR
ncbi:MAG: hypothetical protein A4E48_02758 [Methanosaeta sp. PtaU1.Bin060]|nr:MAG: hypothetical protein A4E48_02758 [Methanosaeta sp. PtaU1.Bin060]